MKYTLAEFQREYPNDAACLDKIFTLRFGSLDCTCPSCGKDTTFRRVVTRRSYQCRLCYHQIYPTANTPFNKTRTPLTYWFYVMFLMTTTRNGVASKEVQRALGVTYKTAHLMTTQVRKLMESGGFRKLKGYVEVDETYVSTGVRDLRKPDFGRGTITKKPIVAAVQRLGEVRAQVMDDVTMKNMQAFFEKNIDTSSHISTDEFPVYKNLPKRGFVNHGVIKHAMEEYRRGVVCTNTVEGFFSHLKRMIGGTHIHVSKQHLHKYLAECVFRYNHRFKDLDMFGCLVLKIADYRENS